MWAKARFAPRPRALTAEEIHVTAAYYPLLRPSRGHGAGGRAFCHPTLVGLARDSSTNFRMSSAISTHQRSEMAVGRLFESERAAIGGHEPRLARSGNHHADFGERDAGVSGFRPQGLDMVGR